jgi:6-phosphogluconolactonase
MLFSILRVGHIHPIPFSASSAEEAAETYARTLESFYGADRLQSNRPLFDLVLLVLGSDGHIASLLPNSHALNERKAWTAVVQGHDYSRVTITYPLLESTREVVLIATGEAKQAALAGWFAGDTSFPVTAFKPSSGIRLFADVAALEPTRECKLV